MAPVLLANVWHVIFGVLLFVTSLFLILLVLVQRGRGGGLAGAFGGMGGQSAFGTKAGDLFTRITMIVAGAWIVLCILAIAVLNSQMGGGGLLGAPTEAPLESPGMNAVEDPPTGTGGGPAESGPAESGPAETPGGAATSGGTPPASDAGGSDAPASGPADGQP